MKQFSRTTGLYGRSLIAAHSGIGLALIAAGGFKSAKTIAKWKMELSDIARVIFKEFFRSD